MVRTVLPVDKMQFGETDIASEGADPVTMQEGIPHPIMLRLLQFKQRAVGNSKNRCQSDPNRSRVKILSATSSISAVMRLAMMTSHSSLKAARSRTTRDPKNCGSCIAGS